MRFSVVAFVVVALLGGCAGEPPAEPAPLDAGVLKKDLFEDCARDAECASGLCLGRGGCAPNECADGCAVDEVCSVTNNAGNRCTPPRVRGERCSFANDVGAREETPCAEGLVCEVIAGGFTAEGLCVPPTGERFLSEPCALDDDGSAPCVNGLTCDAPGICRALAGEACIDDNACSSGQCGPEATCLGRACGNPGVLPDTTDVCIGGTCGTEVGAPAELGEPCFFFVGECPVLHPCAEGLACPLDGGAEVALCQDDGDNE